MKRRLLGRPAIAAHRLAIALLRLLPEPREAGSGTVRLLLTNAYGMGGTIRSTFNLAAALTASREVEIVSVRKHQARPAIRFPAGVAVRVLEDRTAGRGWAARLPSLLVHPQDKSYASSSLLTDVQLVRALRGMAGDVVITTRPAFAIIAAAVAPRSTRVIAQEHLHFAAHGPALQQALRRAYRRVDVVTVLTDADRRALGEGAAPRIVRIPPVHAAPDGRRSTTERPVVVAAGRLVEQKGFDLLIRAFAAVEDPAWRLRIYGGGKERGALQAQIADDRIELMGPTDDLGTVLADAGLFVLPSRYEGFGMVVVEAMGHGVPVVAFDCPHGPGEIITHGVDGLVVPPEDVTALGTAIASLVADPRRRARMGAAAQAASAAYAPATIAARWEQLLAGM